MIDDQARRRAQQPIPDIVRQLRDRAGGRLTPPVVAAAGPMTDAG